MLQALIVLGLLWWTWMLVQLAGQPVARRPGRAAGRDVGRDGAIFVATLAIPEAFDDLPGGLDGPVVLVVAYGIVRLVHMSLYLVAGRDDRALQRQVLRTQLVAMLPAFALLLVGALVGEPAQTWIWLGALAWDLALTLLTGWRR